MANKYAYNKETNEAKTARAMAKSLKISPKHCHRKGQEGWAAGRYPVKAAEQVLKVLENAEANAEYKGMDTENLFIEHISSHRGVVLPGVIPRAFGRMTPFNTPTTHIQIVLQEAN